MSIDQGFETDSVAEHAVPPAGRVAYVKNADGTYSPAAVGAIAAPNGFISAGAANQDSTVVKAASTILVALCFQNNNANSERFVKLYDKATAPTSADTPVARYALAAGGGGVTRQPITQKFVNGLAFRITTGQADNDVGAASAGDVFVNLDCN